MDLLKYMFREGNPIDVAWFVGGVWLLALFLVILARQIFRKKGKGHPHERGNDKINSPTSSAKHSA